MAAPGQDVSQHFGYTHPIKRKPLQSQDMPLRELDFNETAHLITSPGNGHMRTHSNDISYTGYAPQKLSPVPAPLPGDGGGPLHHSSHPWTIYIVAIVLSWAAFLSLVALLVIYNNRALNAWHFFLSLNAVISILGAIARSSLAFAISASLGQAKWNWFKSHSGPLVAFDRFDDASRGPWGSAKLLWWSRFRYPVSVGALCVVLLLGLEPFIQSLISLGDEPVAFGLSNAGQVGSAIGRAVGFDTSATYEQDDLGAAAGFVWKIPGSGNYSVTVQSYTLQDQDYGLTAAGIMGLSPNFSPATPNFVCASGNCTWPLYSTVAICSQCEDISKFVRQWPSNSNLSEPSASWHAGVPEVGLDLENGRMSYQYLRAKAVNTTSNPGRTISFRQYRTLLASIAVLSSKQLGKDNFDTLFNGTAPWNATECALYLCTQVHNTSVQNNVLDDSVIHVASNKVENSYTLEEVMGWNPATSKMGLLNGYKDISTATKDFDQYFNHSLWVPAPYFAGQVPLAVTPQRADLQLSLDDKWEQAVKDSGVPVAANVTTSFNVTYKSIVALSTWLVSYFNTTDALQVLHKTDNMSATFDHVSDSMSKWMRDRVIESSPVNGDTLTNQTILHVKWAYLILPGLTILAGTLYVFFAIVETWRGKLPVWQDSTIATLAFGPDAESRALLRAAVRDGGVDSAAKKFNAEFAQDLNLRLRRKGLS